ncbi:MAG: Holliday junction branch migration protein RuvA [bacterium]
MIAYLRGKIRNKSLPGKKDNFLIVDVNGVGYKVYVGLKLITQAVLDEEMELFIYTQVAETALDLYGFINQEELNFFELLLTISGIGPRSASDIMQKAKIEDLRQGVMTGDYNLLSKLSGIGPKTAEKIVMGLKDKLGSLESVDGKVITDEFGEAMDALMALGYGAFDVREALKHVTATDTSGKIKEALKYLGKK